MSNVSSSNSQGVRVPKLRFPGFEGEWEEKAMDDIFEEVIEKSRPDLPVLSILQGVGTVLRDNFDRRISYDKANLNSYKAMKKGDFIIHLRSFEGGLECSKHNGISSPAYKILRTNCLVSAAYEDYFRSYNFIQGKLSIAVTGIRDGKSIDMPSFWTIKIAMPNIAEQNKIASFLSLLNKRIEKQQQLVEALKSYKRGALSKLFPKKGENTPEYRFRGFTEPWEQRKIKELFKITRGYVLAASMTTDKQTESTPYPVYSSQTKNDGLMGYYNQYLYENAITWTTDGANAGTVNFRNGKFYCTNVCGVLLADTVAPDQMISQALNSVAKNHVSYVGNPKLMNNVMAEITIALPESEKERQVISSILSYYDNLISSHMQKLDGLQSLKAGLLQQLFI